MSANDKYELIGGVLYNTPVDETISEIKSDIYHDAAAVADAILKAASFIELMHIVCGANVNIINYMNSPLVDFLIDYNKLDTWKESPYIGFTCPNCIVYFINWLNDPYTYVRVIKNAIRCDLFNMLKYLITTEKYQWIYEQQAVYLVEVAMVYNKMNTVKYLVETCGIELKESGYLIRVLATQGQLDMIKYLIERCSNVRNYYYDATLCAVEENHLEVVKYIADMPGIGMRIIGDEVFERVLRNDRTDMIKCLIEHGSGRYCVGSGNAIFIASARGNLELVKYLINFSDNNGSQLHHALLGAISGGRLEIVKYLYEEVDDIHTDYKFNHGYFMMMAKESKNKDVIKYIKQRGPSRCSIM